MPAETRLQPIEIASSMSETAMPGEQSTANTATEPSDEGGIRANNKRPAAGDRPCNGLPPGFELRPDGVYARRADGNSDDGNSREATNWERICSPLRVAAVTENGKSEDWGRLLAFPDLDGHEHRWAMPMEMMAGNGDALRAELLRQGLRIEPSQFARQALNRYVMASAPSARVRCVAHIGWHGASYVLPGETFGEEGLGFVLQGPAALQHGYVQSGSLQDWQKEIARYAPGNSRLVLAISLAFAPPLLKLSGLESGGLHLRGPSSCGKTTALHVAGSVWGGGLHGQVRQWRATANGLEGLAEAHCDAVLLIDELTQIAPADAAAAAYMLANGQGKTRADRVGNSRVPKSWRLLYLSSGEIGLAQKIREDSRLRSESAGQAVRHLDVPAVADQARFGIFETLHDFEDPAALAQHLRAASEEFHGVPIRIFLSRLTEGSEVVRERFCNWMQIFQDRFAPTASGQIARAAQRFALVAAAGELATEFGITGWPVGTAIEGVGRCFADWLAARGGEVPMEERQAIDRVRDFIARHRGTRFADLEADPDARQVRNCAGYRRRVGGLADGETQFLIHPAVWNDEICAGMDPKNVARTLHDRGFMLVDGEGKLSIPVRIDGQSQRFRVVRAAILEGADD